MQIIHKDNINLVLITSKVLNYVNNEFFCDSGEIVPENEVVAILPN